MNEQNNNQPVSGGMTFNTPNVNPNVQAQGVIPNPVEAPQPMVIPPLGVNEPVVNQQVVNNMPVGAGSSGVANNVVNPMPVGETPIVNQTVPTMPNPPVSPLNNIEQPGLSMTGLDGNPQPLPGNTLPQQNGAVNNNIVPPVNEGQELPVDDAPSEKPKKKTSPIVIIALIMVLLAGAAVGYYFLLETPQKIFTGAFNKLTTSVNNNGLFDSYVNYNLKVNIDTNNNMFKEYTDIINNINISGTSGYNESDKKFNTKNKILYKNKQLLDLDMLVDINSNMTYMKLNDIFDKVLMVKAEGNEESIAGNIDTNINDYITLKDAYVANVNKTLDGAEYKKELVALDGSRVTKTSLFINKKFVQSFYNNLLQDNSYMTSYAKVSQMTVDEVKAELNKSMTDYNESDKTLIIYTSLIKNDFLKLELNDDGKLTVSKKNNSYSYNYVNGDGNTTDISGTVSITQNGNDTEVVITNDIPEEEIKFDVMLTYSKADKLNDFDISKAVNVDDLTEDETNSIMSKIMSNDGVKQLLKDLGVDMNASDI